MKRALSLSIFALVLAGSRPVIAAQFLVTPALRNTAATKLTCTAVTLGQNIELFLQILSGATGTIVVSTPEVSLFARRVVSIETTATGLHYCIAVPTSTTAGRIGKVKLSLLVTDTTTCVGGTNAGAVCTVNSECPGGTCAITCVGGTNAGAVCTVNSECPGGTCAMPLASVSGQIQ